MLTPSFELHQNSEFLILVIKAPYVKANDVEIYMEEFDFKFYVKPYFLRLTFPCKVIENGKEQATYDIHKGIFTIHIPKLNYGEFFPNLDMLTLLLATNKKLPNKPLIEVVETENVCSDQLDVEIADDEFTWEIEQTLNQDFGSDECYEHKYGFGNKYSGLFASFKGELYEVIDLDSPEQTAPSDRQRQRKSAEIKKFDKDHYIADFMDDELIKPLLEFRPPWLKDYEDILESSQTACHPETETLLKSSLKTYALFAEKSSLFEFTEDEKYQMMQLPQNDHKLSKEDETICCLSLVDILLAYCYDIRTTDGEHTSCSAWNVSKLSSTLSWLEVHKSLKDVLISFASRSLCYPLYRNWDLLNKVIDDTIILFNLGKSHILRCFLDLRKLLQKDENRYLLNELYINDYCVWIQRLTPKKIMSLVINLQNTKICKDDVPFNLRKIEKNAWRDEMGYDSPHNSSSDRDLSSGESSSSSELDSDDTDLEDDDRSDLENSQSESLDCRSRIEESYSKKQLEKNVDDRLNNICINEVNKDFEDSKNQHKTRHRNTVRDDIQCISTGITELLKVQSEI